MASREQKVWAIKLKRRYDDQLAQLEEQQRAIIMQLQQKQGDREKTIKYMQLTKLMRAKTFIYSEQLKLIKHGY